MASSFAWLNTALEVQTFCEDRQFLFAFIGGVAVQRWGEPRVTQDVDLTLFTGFGSEASFIRTFLSHFDPRAKDAAAFAAQSRVLLLWSAEKIPIDIALGGLPFELDIIHRATYGDYYEGVRLKTCSAEDLVVLKAFADGSARWFGSGTGMAVWRALGTRNRLD
jgi:hypothetical protein